MASNSNSENRENAGKILDPFTGWSKSEKIAFLQSIRAFGTDDIAKIQSTIPSLSKHKIATAILYFREKASEQLNVLDNNTTGNKTLNSRVPLTNWANFLSDNFTFKELETIISTAVRMIADLEDIPDAAMTENFDFKKVYHYIADAMEGKKTIPNDPNMNTLIKKCILEAALTTKPFMRRRSFMNIVNRVYMIDKESAPLPKITEDTELNIIKYLTAQKNYNPLNISEQFLKFSHHNEFM